MEVSKDHLDEGFHHFARGRCVDLEGPGLLGPMAQYKEGLGRRQRGADTSWPSIPTPLITSNPGKLNQGVPGGNWATLKVVNMHGGWGVQARVVEPQKGWLFPHGKVAPFIYQNKRRPCHL